MKKRTFRPRQRIGKYRIERFIAGGGFAEVYQALDTIEGMRVALKIPHPRLVDDDLLADFRREVRITAQLDHPNILRVKNAAFIDNHFVVAMPLGERTLTDRLKSRISTKVALGLAEQMLDALAFAHRRKVLHGDIKPDNFILFPDNRVRLSDFGIAKVAAVRTFSASGSGTIGYIAPEQAMGKPSLRSDVFSIGLVLYQLFARQLPEWPFRRPLPGYKRLAETVHPDLITLMERAIDVDPSRRFSSADRMRAAFRRVKPRAFQHDGRRRKRRSARSSRSSLSPQRDWTRIRARQFVRRFGKIFGVRGTCRKCEGPIAESMQSCCWCGTRITRYHGKSAFTRSCPRCRRGMKPDWRYCPWCYGASIPRRTDREYPDSRYSAKCDGKNCVRRELMPFMRYCPWCHKKTRRNWSVPKVTKPCGSCGWGVVDDFWVYCPWCSALL